MVGFMGTPSKTTVTILARLCNAHSISSLKCLQYEFKLALLSIHLPKTDYSKSTLTHFYSPVSIFSHEAIDLATIMNFKFLLLSHFSQPLPQLILNCVLPECFQLSLNCSLCSTPRASLIQFQYFLMSDLSKKQTSLPLPSLKILIGSPLSIALSLNSLT